MHTRGGSRPTERAFYYFYTPGSKETPDSKETRGYYYYFLPTCTSFPGDGKLTKCRSVSGMVTTGTQKQSTSWSDVQH